MGKVVLGVALWKRIFAYFVDMSLLIFVVLSPLTGVFSSDFSSEENIIDTFSSFTSSFSFDYILFAFVFAFFVLLYFSVLECWFGQTVGKIIVGIRVEGTQNKGVSFLQGIIRNITKLSGFLLTLDTLYLLLKKGEQRYFETLSDTHVVEEVVKYA